MREPDSVVPASRGSLGSLASEGFVVLTCDPGAGLIQTCNAERREDDERVRGHGVKATRGWFIDCLRLDLKSTLIKNWHSLMASIWFLDNTACDRIDEPRDEQRAGSEGSLRGQGRPGEDARRHDRHNRFQFPRPTRVGRQRAPNCPEKT